MPSALILLLQAAASAQPSPAPYSFDLKAMESPRDIQFRLNSTRGCASDDPTEIVVCGSRGNPERYRLPPLTSDFEIEALRAEAELIEGVTGGVHVEGAQLPNGMTSNRVMLRTKIKF